MINHLKDDTIAAISTAPGVGGIAVIRISGNQSIEIVSSIFKANKKDVEIKTASAYQAIYGTIYECEEEIDKNAPACNLQAGAFTCGYFFRALR